MLPTLTRVETGNRRPQRTPRRNADSVRGGESSVAIKQKLPVSDVLSSCTT